MKDLLVPIVLGIMLGLERHYHVCLRERLERIEEKQAGTEKRVAMVYDEVLAGHAWLLSEFDRIHIQKKPEPAISTVAPTPPPGAVIAAGALTLSPEVHWETLDEILDRREKK